MVKRLFRSKIFLCILTALITGTVSVYAVTYFPSNQVTYDNKTSGLKSSDVQGAIDELYNTCSSAVSSGDYMYFSVGSYSTSGVSGIRPSIYRMSINSGNVVKIYSYEGFANIENMFITNDYIYFSLGSYSTNGVSDVRPAIYRMSINGENVVKIYSYEGFASIESMFVTDDYIFFSLGSRDADTSSGDVPVIYRVSINGGKETKIYSYNNFANIESMFIK